MVAAVPDPDAVIPAQAAMFYGLAVVRACALAQARRVMPAVELLAQICHVVPDKGYAAYMDDWAALPCDAAPFPYVPVLQCVMPMLQATTGRPDLFPAERASLAPWAALVAAAWVRGWLSAATTPPVVLLAFAGVAGRALNGALAVDLALAAVAREATVPAGIALGTPWPAWRHSPHSRALPPQPWRSASTATLPPAWPRWRCGAWGGGLVLSIHRLIVRRGAAWRAGGGLLVNGQSTPRARQSQGGDGAAAVGAGRHGRRAGAH